MILKQLILLYEPSLNGGSGTFYFAVLAPTVGAILHQFAMNIKINPSN